MELIKGKHYFLKGQHLNIISGISYTKGHIVQTEHDDACRKRSYRYKGTVSRNYKGTVSKDFSWCRIGGGGASAAAGQGRNLRTLISHTQETDPSTKNTVDIF